MAVPTLTFAADSPSSVSGARRELAQQMREWDCGRTDDAVLVFSELVTNAVRHAGGATHVRVLHGTHQLRFEVHDTTSDAPAIRRHVGDEPGGAGLRIVDAVAIGWGWEQTATGKVVWCELPCCLDV